jgi:hypothetical protein
VVPSGQSGVGQATTQGKGRGMERIRTMALARVIVGAAVCTLAVIGWSGASTALASAPTVTLSGTDNDGRSPDSTDHIAVVSATLSKGVASGSLSTHLKATPGRSFSPFVVFEGNVTCMDVDGKRVTVGAFGTDRLSGHFSEAEKEFQVPPGTYAQVLTVEFGTFPLYHTVPERFATNSFGVLGEHGEGLRSDTPPNCNKRYSFASQILPFIYASEPSGVERLIHISPSITSPKDGHVSHRGTVKLSGTGEPNRAITVYEVGYKTNGTEVTADARGKWSLTLSGLSVGTHVFTASAVNGSEIPANTVEVIVKK